MELGATVCSFKSAALSVMSGAEELRGVFDRHAGKPAEREEKTGNRSSVAVCRSATEIEAGSC
jgi:hypothetical protein